MLHQLHPVDLGTSGQNSTPRVKYFILKKPLKLTDIFKHFNITPLRPIEEAFILEYVKVMAPVAAALDILQGDQNIHWISSSYSNCSANSARKVKKKQWNQAL